MNKYYQNAIKLGEQEAEYLNYDLIEKIVKFVYECREKNVFPKPSQEIKSYLRVKGLLKPIPFCAFVYNVFNNNCCTVNKSALNKSYQIFAECAHNNTAPRYIFDHYDCTWEECDITFFGFSAVKEEQPKEESSESLPDYILQLQHKIQTLLELQILQNEKIDYLASIVATKNKTEEDEKLCFKIDQNEMIQYLLQNDKLNLTFKAGE